VGLFHYDQGIFVILEDGTMFGLNKNTNTQVAAAAKDTPAKSRQAGRRSRRFILVPKMVGSMMVMTPWGENNGGPDWPEFAPPNGR
jgi:hypothetical protein